MEMYTEFIIRLVVASLMGVIIGLEREYRSKEAGYRTHFLVALGSALLMIVSQYGFSEVLETELVRLDPSRLAAQVVSGIGFIGAGTIILLQKQIVRGLTTASRHMGHIRYRTCHRCRNVRSGHYGNGFVPYRC